MKKFSILFAAVALMAMTACNEKPAKNEVNADANAPATEQVDTAQAMPTRSIRCAWRILPTALIA